METDDWWPAWDDSDADEWVGPWADSDTNAITTTSEPALSRMTPLLDRGAVLFPHLFTASSEVQRQHLVGSRSCPVTHAPSFLIPCFWSSDVSGFRPASSWPQAAVLPPAVSLARIFPLLLAPGHASSVFGLFVLRVLIVRLRLPGEPNAWNMILARPVVPPCGTSGVGTGLQLFREKVFGMASFRSCGPGIERTTSLNVLLEVRLTTATCQLLSSTRRTPKCVQTQRTLLLQG